MRPYRISFTLALLLFALVTFFTLDFQSGTLLACATMGLIGGFYLTLVARFDQIERSFAARR